MNYLAHTLLSHQSDEEILGAVLGDFVKGPLGQDYSPTVRDAIALHRAIDRYTDSHSAVLSSCRLVSSSRRRFAPIMVDVFYDHFLARDWSNYCDVPLHRFARQVYDVLQRHQSVVPDRLRQITPRMATNDWLNTYADVTGMQAAINGIAYRLRRFRRADVLHGGAVELVQNYTVFERDFRHFFPELQNYVAQYRLGRAA